ncbi:carbamoyl phosphate synthase small subunit [Pontibacillus salipaludis]|uniref:Carbamoyl phosphate synthase small chain n=1 Tax=Pontibacillus salipaludis TaxID=1697394 RepID=A0ABQ1QAX7_9BACI|nr:carbamoyl phosphate synthase small subunit [Pontibacillus salipaludis]GGD20710.1 carbamoyl-phosphate synthase arginine-specific small chain [Pontibacillus salipaludis]
MKEKGYLLLENGVFFEGVRVGSTQDMTGEVVFNTSMTGYQEILTDPSYADQIIVFCYPLIGNYGINDVDGESEIHALSGAVFGEACDIPSHYESQSSLVDYLNKYNISGLVNIDTRALVKIIRKEGTMRGKIVSSIHEQVAKPFFTHKQHTLVEEVSVKSSVYFEGGSPHIVIVDYGYKKSIRTSLQAEGCRVTVVPYSSSYEWISSLNPDGVLFSNGPGNPEELSYYYPTIKKLSESYPCLGICLGHQLLALSHGASTTKLHYGHRGGNHPVKNLKTNKVYITSQNHGYEVMESSLVHTSFTATHLNVNDRTVEGMVHTRLPVLGVQFHPEAHAGPSDTSFILKEFIQLVKENAHAAS